MVAPNLKTSALIVVDVQNDFTTGSLAVNRAGMIFEYLNIWVDTFEFFQSLVVYTFDWHPQSTPHFEEWPVHCVAGTEGAYLDKRAHMPNPATHPVMMVRKGLGVSPGYSPFEAGSEVLTLRPHRGIVNLDQALAEYNVDTLFIAGLATDYCVKATALDAVKLGYRTILLYDACAPVGAGQEACLEMAEAGVEIYIQGMNFPLTLEQLRAIV